MTALDVVAAIAEPSRWALLQELAAHGPASASRLAERSEISRQAIVKHLVALERTGLVTRSRHGHEQRFTAEPAPLLAASDWLADRARAWQGQLGLLKSAAERIAAERPAQD